MQSLLTRLSFPTATGKDTVILGKTAHVSFMKWKMYSKFSRIGADRRRGEEIAPCFPVKRGN
jgi:hypothetical protein